MDFWIARFILEIAARLFLEVVTKNFLRIIIIPLIFDKQNLPGKIILLSYRIEGKVIP